MASVPLIRLKVFSDEVVVEEETLLDEDCTLDEDFTLVAWEEELVVPAALWVFEEEVVLLLVVVRRDELVVVFEEDEVPILQALRHTAAVIQARARWICFIWFGFLISL